jgi:hypothetical protein
VADVFLEYVPLRRWHNQGARAHAEFLHEQEAMRIESRAQGNIFLAPMSGVAGNEAGPALEKSRNNDPLLERGIEELIRQV